MELLRSAIVPVDHGFLSNIAVHASPMNTLVTVRYSREDNRYCGLDEFWTALQSRTSSRPLDVTTCGSILQGTDLTRVLVAPDDKKMEVFWMCQRKVIAFILFLYVPRLDTHGFRWAPSYLRSSGSSSLRPWADYSGSRSDLDVQASPS
jgi:hypothetical protein